MSFRSLALGITVTGIVLARSAAAQPIEAETPWDEVVARASAAGEPIVAFSHFPLCPPESACGAFVRLAAHPANQRRLAGKLFVSRELDEGEETEFVSVHTPDGARIIRWSGIPDAAQFSRMLTGIDEATPHLVSAYRASAGGCDSEATRETALALLALGYELKARPALEALRESGSDEDRQLAAIWIERLDARAARRLPDERLLRSMARDGIGVRVRFEAWMGLGDILLARLLSEEAIGAYQNAVQLAPDPSPERESAVDARRRAEMFAAPVRGLGSPGSIVTGRRTVWPRLVPEETARVEVRLDDRLVAVGKKAPFAVSVDFGRVPKPRLLRVTALSAKGVTLRDTSIRVNDRVDAFSVDIVEPSSPVLSGNVTVTVAVKVPQGRQVRSVVIEWNGTRVARLDAPPYVGAVTIRPDEQGVLRAAATLDDGAELEDVLLVNSGSMTLESDVQLVEVPVYSEGSEPLARERLKVREDGKDRTVDRVVPASEAPLLVALLIDASWSMTENMLDVQEAAIRFVEKHTTPRDRVMVIGFDTKLRILWPTGDRSRIERAILSIQAQGYTSLNDALLNALLQLQAPGWRRALVVFSDGLDNTSSFTAGDVSDVAKRSGVPIYVMSLRPAPPVGAPRLAMQSARWVFAARTELMKIAWNSGGKAFDLTSLQGLAAIWDEVGDDLGKQSLVVYHPASGAREWRAIEVFDGTKRLRAPSGIAVASERPERER